MQHGWESYIVSSKADAFRQSRNTSYQIGGKVDFYLHVLETRLMDNPGLGIASKSPTKDLISLIESVKPDLIYLHLVHGYYLNLKLLFKYLSAINIPVVWTIHSCWEISGHCTCFEMAGCDKWKRGCYECPQSHSYPKSWFIENSPSNYKYKKELFNSIDNLTLIPVSKWLQSILNESFLKNKRIIPIYNGIDTTVFSYDRKSISIKEKHGLKDKFVALGVASSWDERKNLKDYVKLSELLPDDMIIILIGLNKKQKLNLPSNIIAVNRTTDIQELVDYYCGADVVLNLSLEETFGLTTVEGMSCGTPGIVYSATASPELVTKKTGYVIEKGDVTGVLSAMLDIKKRNRSDFSYKCREHVELHFDKTKCFEEYIKLYNSLAGGGKSIIVPFCYGERRAA